jgi:hypothetical protein
VKKYETPLESSTLVKDPRVGTTHGEKSPMRRMAFRVGGNGKRSERMRKKTSKRGNKLTKRRPTYH